MGGAPKGQSVVDCTPKCQVLCLALHIHIHSRRFDSQCGDQPRGLTVARSSQSIQQNTRPEARLHLVSKCLFLYPLSISIHLRNLQYAGQLSQCGDYYGNERGNRGSISGTVRAPCPTLKKEVEGFSDTLVSISTTLHTITTTKPELWAFIVR